MFLSCHMNPFSHEKKSMKRPRRLHTLCPFACWLSPHRRRKSALSKDLSDLLPFTCSVSPAGKTVPARIASSVPFGLSGDHQPYHIAISMAQNPGFVNFFSFQLQLLSFQGSREREAFFLAVVEQKGGDIPLAGRHLARAEGLVNHPDAGEKRR